LYVAADKAVENENDADASLLGLKDFQKLNSSSCGMGILARPTLTAGKDAHPTRKF
jgi:hypothetical protein